MRLLRHESDRNGRLGQVAMKLAGASAPRTIREIS